MSISLNNHENRIKALEEKQHDGNFQAVVLATGFGELSQSIRNFQAIIVEAIYDFGGVTSLFMETTGIDNKRLYVCDGIDASRITFVFETDQTLIMRYSNRFKGVGRVIGLKLYYNFSYNIYRLIYTFLEFLFKEV